MSTMLTLFTESEQPETGVWNYISPSRLNCWMSCPLKFKFRYVDGIRPPPTPSLFLGKQAHAGLELYYRHRMLGITLTAEDVMGRMDASWDDAVAEEEMGFDSIKEELALRKQAQALVRTYLDQVPPDEPKPLAVEAKMDVPLVDPANGEDLGIPLLGIVDLILDGPDGATIIDFKTAARSSPPYEITHEVQLSAYAYGFAATAGRDATGLEIRSLIKTKNPKIAIHQYPARGETHFARLFALIREYIDALNRGIYNYRPGWGCSMCEFRETDCREWCGSDSAAFSSNSKNQRRTYNTW